MHSMSAACRPESFIWDSNSRKLSCVTDQQKQNAAGRYQTAHRYLNVKYPTDVQSQLLHEKTTNDRPTCPGRQ